MRLEVVRENQVDGTNAIPGKLYIDGEFFGYTLENSDYIAAPGTWPIFAQKSSTFGRTKIYVDVPGRIGIMFHGGNKTSNSKGCILLARNRTSADTIQGDLSDVLVERYQSSYSPDESTVTITTLEEKRKKTLLLIAAFSLAVIIITRR